MAMADWEKMGQDAIGEILEWTKGAKDFVSAQAPEVVKEILRWGFWSNLIWVAFSIGVMWLLLKVSNWWMDYTPEGDENDKPAERSEKLHPAYSGFVCICYAGIAVFGIFIIIDLLDVLYITIAPRLYLIDYLKGMMQ